MRLGSGPGAPDDIETLLREQTAHFLSEARVVIDDQAAQRHVALTIAGTAGRAIAANPQTSLQGSLRPAVEKLLRCPRSEDAESPSGLSPRSDVPRLAGIRPSGRPHTRMGTARADMGSTPRNHARHVLRTQSRSRAMNAVGCRLSEFALGTTDATAYRVAQAPAVRRKGRHWNFGTSDIS